MKGKYNIFILVFWITILYVIDLNERLRQVRKSINKTQKDFGGMLGVSRDTYASYETGRVIPNDTFIQLLCSMFNVNEEWLRNGVGEMYGQTKTSILDEFGKAHNLTNTEKAIVEAFVDLSPVERSAVVDYIKKAFSKITFAEAEQRQPPSREAAIVSEILNKNKIIAEEQKINK